MNNFNADNFNQTKNAITQNPAHGIFPFHAHLKWEDGLFCKVKIRDFEPLKIDEPFELGGQNRGFNPVEYLITGAVGCFTLVVIINASLQNIKINSLETELDTKLDLGTLFAAVAGGRHGIGDVTLTLHIDADASKEKIDELVQLALKYSPSINSLNIPIRVVVDKK